MFFDQIITGISEPASLKITTENCFGGKKYQSFAFFTL